jgi:hypothetical protein
MRPPDEPISPEEVLYRRIYCDWITFDDGIPRASSVAFRDRKEHKVSVVVARETSVRRLLRGRPEDSVVSIIAKDVIDLGFRVERDFDPEQPGHAVIIPTPNIGKAKKIAATAKWVKLRNPNSTFFKARRWWMRLVK